MPKISAAKVGQSCYHLDQIRSVASGLLNSHKKLDWSQRTRSNRDKTRLEAIYFALGELETVLKHWNEIQGVE